jgi:hypothetical protein
MHGTERHAEEADTVINDLDTNRAGLEEAVVEMVKKREQEERKMEDLAWSRLFKPDEMDTSIKIDVEEKIKKKKNKTRIRKRERRDLLQAQLLARGILYLLLT